MAVVVALAMAAVFGAISLTNPAFAAVGAPADAELAEREFQPQDAPSGLKVALTEAANSVRLTWKDQEDVTAWQYRSRFTEDVALTPGPLVALQMVPALRTLSPK